MKTTGDDGIEGPTYLNNQDQAWYTVRPMAPEDLTDAANDYTIADEFYDNTAPGDADYEIINFNQYQIPFTDSFF